MPWRETLAWLDHSVLPYPGGLRQQPFLLWAVMEIVIERIQAERGAHARAEREQMIAMMNR